MNSRLMYRDRELDLAAKIPANAPDLIQDLELETIFKAMAGDDEFIYSIVKPSILQCFGNDVDTVMFRQSVLADVLCNESTIENFYALACEALDAKKRRWLGLFSKSPSSVLAGSSQIIQVYLDILERLRTICREAAHHFSSEGFLSFFDRMEAEFPDEYFAEIRSYLAALRFPNGVLISARMGQELEGQNYTLRRSLRPPLKWWQRLFAPTPAHSFEIAERDQAGAQFLSDLQDRGLNSVANSLAQSSDQILGFFQALKTELAFYRGCANLYRQLLRKGIDLCTPLPSAAGTGRQNCEGLQDVCLALSSKREIIGSDVRGDGLGLVIITGANQGGKSTFLRAVGVAQMMMQSGMFVAARALFIDLCPGLFTHYKREEDERLEAGKFDEELIRMSEIVGQLVPGSLMLFNESFAATNEREGSEIADQIVRSLRERQIRVFYVTHQFTFAHGFADPGNEPVLFLRAGREADGQRTFKLLEGPPLATSYGEDLYRNVFAPTSDASPTATECRTTATPL